MPRETPLHAARDAGYDWQRIFALSVNGTSLGTLYACAAAAHGGGESLLVVKDSVGARRVCTGGGGRAVCGRRRLRVVVVLCRMARAGHVFGAYCVEEWAPNAASFFGGGRAMVFCVQPLFEVYKWSRCVAQRDGGVRGVACAAAACMAECACENGGGGGGACGPHLVGVGVVVCAARVRRAWTDRRSLRGAAWRAGKTSGFSRLPWTISWSALAAGSPSRSCAGEVRGGGRTAADAPCRARVRRTRSCFGEARRTVKRSSRRRWRTTRCVRLKACLAPCVHRMKFWFELARMSDSVALVRTYMHAECSRVEPLCSPVSQVYFVFCILICSGVGVCANVCACIGVCVLCV